MTRTTLLTALLGLAFVACAGQPAVGQGGPNDEDPTKQVEKAQAIAKRVTDHLGGYGLFGVELFLCKDDRVIFSEVSPRPHDTGMVTMATQVWSEFALHARAILGLPIAKITRFAAGASVALRAEGKMESPVIEGLAEAYATPDVDVRFFGKPNATARRRLGVVLATAEDAKAALVKATQVASGIKLRDA
jgi:phosphoribosylglycinamide formyltransferase 2